MLTKTNFVAKETLKNLSVKHHVKRMTPDPATNYDPITSIFCVYIDKWKGLSPSW